MRIFLSPEYHKQRFGLIIRTIDINEDTKMEYTADVDFEHWHGMITGHMKDELTSFKMTRKRTIINFCSQLVPDGIFRFSYQLTVPSRLRQWRQDNDNVLNWRNGSHSFFLLARGGGGARALNIAKAGAAALKRVATQYGVALNDDTPTVDTAFEHRVQCGYGLDNQFVAKLSAKKHREIVTTPQ
jgi:hypothetical protein